MSQKVSNWNWKNKETGEANSQKAKYKMSLNFKKDVNLNQIYRHENFKQ